MDEKYDSMIQPHGGQLIDREYLDKERLELLNHAHMMPSLTVSAWEISDIELIGIGGFSPLTGFMKESDYLSVIHNVRLENGLVWSIPITLADRKSTRLNSSHVAISYA